MSETIDHEARSLLRQRLGAGARYDSNAAPAEELLWARRGTAYFARKLNELSDAELDGPSRVKGWSRRHVVAYVGYNARRLARIVAAARQNSPVELPPEEFGPPETIELGATLPAHALRYLFQHAAIHLTVEWRDLTDEGWERSIAVEDGQTFPVRGTALSRAREIWERAVDLNKDASVRDMPASLAKRMRQDLKPAVGVEFIGYLPADPA